ncbi:MAG: GNAT family N-acetyltransferase [Chloroflexota bacterium]
MDVRILQAADAAAYRVIRRRALVEHPESFGSSPARIDAMTDADIVQRLTGGAPDNVTFGAFAGGELVGIVGVVRMPGEKRQHTAEIISMYVMPVARGQQAGHKLIAAALAHLRGRGVQQVTLSVTSGNVAARRLYRKLGFITWGVQPAYIRVGDVDYDVEHMINYL